MAEAGIDVGEVNRRLLHASGHVSTHMSGSDWARAMELLTKVLTGEPEGRLELNRRDLKPFVVVGDFLTDHLDLLGDGARRMRWSSIAQDLVIVSGA